MRRAAVSVGANIAEGQRRKTKKDFSNFLVIAEGSLAEVQHYLLLARDLEFIDEAKFNELNAQAAVVEKMLVGLQRSMRTA
jgi:four helix bundle protein